MSEKKMQRKTCVLDGRCDNDDGKVMIQAKNGT